MSGKCKNKKRMLSFSEAKETEIENRGMVMEEEGRKREKKLAVLLSHLNVMTGPN